MASTSLRIDDRVLSRCDDGLLEAEYALFDPGEIELHATDPVTIREVGYVTTARAARARLAEAGVTAKLASEAARALSTEVVATYARGAIVRQVLAELEAYELFEGRTYRSPVRLFDGVWLDLRSLASEIKVPKAGIALQALHLAAALDEVDDDASVFLSTADIMLARRPGLRSHRRVSLAHAGRIPLALRALTAHARVDGGWGDEPHDNSVHDDSLRDELLRLVRERAISGVRDEARGRLATLDLALAATDTPKRGPLADPELWTIERELAAGESRGVEERINIIERVRGVSIATKYLRARARMAEGIEAPRSIAARLSELAASDDTFHELELLTARAWLAAGETAHARYYARGLIEDAGARDEVRLLAIEILDATPETKRSMKPPPVGPPARRASTPVVKSVVAAPIIAVVAEVVENTTEIEVEFEAAPPGVPPGASQPPYASERPAAGAELVHVPKIPAPIAPRIDELPPVVRFGPATSARRAAPAAEAPPIDTTGTTVAVATPVPPERPPSDRPPPMTPPPPPNRARHEPEIIESLSMPPGIDDSAKLAVGTVPRTPLEARVMFTQLARELARDYRLWYGSALRTDTLAIDAMQRHLRRMGEEGRTKGPAAMWELQRHGAMLSEILARALGAVWVDVAPSELGYWAMLVPPATRTWPFGRLYRFLTMGHREKDLVSYYLDLDARVKAARAADNTIR
jgi:hypothetical protein